MGKRSGNNPKRRIVDPQDVTPDQVNKLLEEARYVGSGHHKRNPADYGFDRTNPRPTKSLCDAGRVVTLEEAKSLLKSGILKKMISSPAEDGLPKYIWSVSETGEPFESKTHPGNSGDYHGYPLEVEDDMRERVLKSWSER